tara:strand:- start:102 stop:986 length:885 start_codon:yes stop_codon:yes gene_type:complete
MKKTLDYLYIFSKLSTSFILLLSLIILGYFFYISFKSQKETINDQAEFINKLNQNSEKLSKLTKQIENTDTSLDELQDFIKNKTNVDNSEEISLLNKKIEELDLGLEKISINLQEMKITNIPKPNKNNANNISIDILNKNKLEIATLVIYKFENNLDFTEEINLLQNYNNNKNQHIFEKINLIKLKKFRGNIFLKNIYSQELDFYLKEKFNKQNSNFISKSLIKLLVIEPSKKNIIKNNEINILNEISDHLDNKNYKMSYKKIINIQNYEKYFSKTISQIQIVNEFKELINKTI